MKASTFINTLKRYQGDNVFNPYADICPVCDRYNADQIRRKNLKSVLESAINNGVDDIWIGRDLGYKGGRRTGLALTDEANFEDANSRWHVELQLATKDAIIAERTAANIWKHLNRTDKRVFMWNVFPFHPHEKNKPFTNRMHRASERDVGIELLDTLITMLKPKAIVALGNDAYQCTTSMALDIPVHKVRHPSYGGEKDFHQKLNSLYP